MSLPQFLLWNNTRLTHHLGSIISQSWGTQENTLFSSSGGQEGDRRDFESFYSRAVAAQNVTVLAGAGDSGAANVDVNGNFLPLPDRVVSSVVSVCRSGRRHNNPSHGHRFF